MARTLNVLKLLTKLEEQSGVGIADRCIYGGIPQHWITIDIFCKMWFLTILQLQTGCSDYPPLKVQTNNKEPSMYMCPECIVL